MWHKYVQGNPTSAVDQSWLEGEYPTKLSGPIFDDLMAKVKNSPCRQDYPPPPSGVTNIQRLEPADSVCRDHCDRLSRFHLRTTEEADHAKNRGKPVSGAYYGDTYCCDASGRKDPNGGHRRCCVCLRSIWHEEGTKQRLDGLINLAIACVYAHEETHYQQDNPDCRDGDPCFEPDAYRAELSCLQNALQLCSQYPKVTRDKDQATATPCSRFLSERIAMVIEQIAAKTKECDKRTGR